MAKTQEAPARTAEERNAALLRQALARLAEREASDPGLRQWTPLPAVLEVLQDPDLSAIEVLERACVAYAQRPALGERGHRLERTAAGTTVTHLPAFDCIPYSEVWQRTVELAAGLHRDPRTAVKPGEVVAICGFGSIDYVIADLACLYLGAVSAVLPMSVPAEDLESMANEAEFACIICARESARAVLRVLPACPSVRSMVVMDLHEEASDEAADLEQARAATGLPLLTMREVAEAGRAAPPPAPFRPVPGSEQLASLMYTSGSTGRPKGAMMTHGVWRCHWLLAPPAAFTRFPSVGINFYPLSHAMGRLAVLRTLVLGGVMHFTLKSDMSTLFEDIRLTRPTFLALVPRISEMIHQAFRADLLRREQAGLDPALARDQAHAAMRFTFLGDRLGAAMIGSAPTAPEVAAFLAECFRIPVYDGFGTTEAGIIAVDGRICRPWVTAYRLVGVPELGYRLDDRPHPRGELQVRTRHCVPGYHRNREATQALYTDDGFMCTGDIVEERGADQVVWVDRKNNVVKLAQGEFVTLWRLESLFSGGSSFLDQVYMYANSQRAYPLAVVVPDGSAVAGRLLSQDGGPSPAAVVQLLQGEINRLAGVARLRPYEVPRALLVETERWTRDNGLLTGVNKPARPQLRAKYGQRLEALYVEVEQKQQADLAALGHSREPLATKLAKTVAAVLGLAEVDPASGSFTDLGGDSMSALSLAALLEEVTGTRLPVAEILNPGTTLLALVGRMRTPRDRQSGGLPSFSEVHGGEPASIQAEALRLANFLGADDLTGAAAPPRAAVRAVLLTGANGFLGHVLCLEWLEAMARVGGRVYALVRAANDPAAADRLQAAYRTGDEALEQRFAVLAARHLVVLAGDFAAPGLGLSAEVYEHLAGEVDLVVHAGALVNHVFTYEQLFAPNVAGTANLIGFALRERRKRFDYVSSIGVLAGARVPGQVAERDGVDALLRSWPVTGGYAHGYATSKWASEVLLKELYERFETPVRVFRPDLILPHRRYRGQVNSADLLTRLLLSVIESGLAPRSFYAGRPGHYDGLPVDFIAAALVALSSAHQGDLATYQVSNPHRQDGISLDTLMDWVASAGYRLERISDYSAWFAAFSARLRELPPARRQRSALPILHLWAQPSPGLEAGAVDASQFDRQIRLCQPGGEAAIPHLSEAFLHKYLEDLRALGLL